MKVPRNVKIVAIETVPMTTGEYKRAVNALAVLIAAWEEKQMPDHDPQST